MLHERIMQRLSKISRATKLGVSRAVGQDPSLGELSVRLRVQSCNRAVFGDPDTDF
jgi:hypothetical protein